MWGYLHFSAACRRNLRRKLHSFVLLDMMGSVRLILQFSLFFTTLGLIWSCDPVLNLQCFNDYDTEMVCHLCSEELSCPEYNLNVSIHMIKTKLFTCGFKYVSASGCQCKFQVPSFVAGESFDAVLWKREKILKKQFSTTTESIKPKQPIILSVNQTQNGNFLISWDTNYTQKNTFSDSLATELVYIAKESGCNKTVNLGKNRNKYEIVGKHLQPNTDYIVMARVSTEYNENKIFSDYSKPYEFRTSSSTQDTLKIMIPILCVILILFISTVYYCYIKLVREWWNKIPSPKIANISEKAVPYLLTFENVPTDHLESSKVPLKDKTEISPTQTDVSNIISLQSGGSAQVNYGLTVSEDVENFAGNEDLLEEYKHAGQCMCTDNQRDHSSSSFNNRSYMESDTSHSSSLKPSILHSAYPCNEPVIITDFAYGPFNGFSGPGGPILAKSNLPSTEIVFVPGYQSVNELLDQQNNVDEQTFIGFHNDVNLIKTTPKNPQDFHFPASEDVSLIIDEEYKSFSNLDQNSLSSDHNTEQNISQTVAQTALHNMSFIHQQVHAPSCKSLCGSNFNNSPSIQIVHSYQKV